MARIPRAMIGLAFVAALGAAVWWFVRGAPPAEVASEPSGPGGPGDRGTAPERPDVTPPKTFTFASACRTLDPALATDHASVQVAVQLFEGLTEIDRDGQPAPLGAERWETTDEGRTYTFTLRSDRVWTTGEPVTAHDYVWAWRRAIDPRTAADYASLFYAIKNGARIHGERLDAALLGVTARDARTLVVNLEEPLAHFPWLTALAG